MDKLLYKVRTNSSVLIPNNCLEDIQLLLDKLKLSRWLDSNILRIPQGMIGCLHTMNISIEIVPSISYLNTVDYLRLLHPGRILNKSDNGYLSFKEDKTVSHYIIEEFLSNFNEVLGDGLPRRYLVTEERSDYLKGNVDFVTSYERYLSQDSPVFVTNNHILSHNFYALQVIKAAYLKVISASKKYIDYSLMSILCDVNEGQALDLSKSNNISFSKNEQKLSYLFKLALIILRNMEAFSGKDDLEMSLLINANNIFEFFLFELLLSQFPNDKFEYKVRKIAANGDKEIESEIDILFTGSHSILIDAKNKNYDKEILNSDYYQMFSYFNTWGINTAVLVYPYVKNLPPKVFIPREALGLRVYTLPLNILPNEAGLIDNHFAEFGKEYGAFITIRLTSRKFVFSSLMLHGMPN